MSTHATWTDHKHDFAANWPATEPHCRRCGVGWNEWHHALDTGEVVRPLGCDVFDCLELAEHGGTLRDHSWRGGLLVHWTANLCGGHLYLVSNQLKSTTTKATA